MVVLLGFPGVPPWNFRLVVRFFIRVQHFSQGSLLIEPLPNHGCSIGVPKGPPLEFQKCCPCFFPYKAARFYLGKLLPNILLRCGGKCCRVGMQYNQAEQHHTPHVHGPPEDTVSEWLRRWTRNPLGSARKGSNPFGVVLHSC